MKFGTLIFFTQKHSVNVCKACKVKIFQTLYISRASMDGRNSSIGHKLARLVLFPTPLQKNLQSRSGPVQIPSIGIPDSFDYNSRFFLHLVFGESEFELSMNSWVIHQ